MTTDKPRGPRVLLWTVLAALLLFAGLQPLITFWIVDHVTADSRGDVARLEHELAAQQERIDELEATRLQLSQRVAELEAAPRAERMRWRREADPKGRVDSTAHEWTGIREEEKDRYVIELATFDFALQRLDVLGREARIVQNFSDGRTNGFKLFGIRRGGLFELMGLRNGDVVSGIDEHPLTDPEAAMEIYGNIAERDRFSIQVHRRGEPRSFEYRIE